jgi:hypothetical protein
MLRASLTFVLAIASAVGLRIESAPKLRLWTSAT